MESAKTLLTIDELAHSVAAALAESQVQSPNGRVREIPDVRTLRFYTTIGLLDRPTEMRGRTALYGPRHVLQLVSIKRLQAAGLSLAEVQAHLLNASDDELRRLAQLPEHFQVVGSPATARNDAQLKSPAAESREPPRMFWKSQPARAASDSASGGLAPATSAVPHVLVAIALGHDVSLLFPSASAPSADDVEALRAASVPLLETLRQRRLLT
jgi:DNA-binding transcriptional MerR regulator